MQKVYIIGAGPGNPDLLTVKAHRLITTADVVLHDELFGTEILQLIPSSAIMFNVGKLCGDHQHQTERQTKINDLMLHYFREGYSVVRLKTGDPLMFGRGIEEVRFLIEHSVAYQLVPGITAGVAAANQLSIPLTERMKNTAVLFCTGQALRTDVDQFIDVVNFLKSGNPVVVYMGYNNLERITQTLINNGVKPETKVCVVSKVSHLDQDSVLGDLLTIHKELRNRPMASPTVILIGKYVEALALLSNV